jgi:uncharacterized membrane protein
MRTEAAPPANRRPLISAGTLLGIGMGGFADGIVLHQVLQVHNMLSAKRPKDSILNMQINMFWDGLFHAFTWVLTALGLWLLWKAVRRRDVPLSGRTLLGAMVFGWGLFNLVEGIIDHHLLNIHHVVERYGRSGWDWLFLGIGGVGFILIGWAIMRSIPAASPTVQRAA